MPVFGGDNPESYYDEALTASMKGDLERAVEYFEKTIHMDNTFVAAYHQLGKCYLRMGHNKKALGLLKQVVAKKPTQAPARLDLASAYLKEGDTQEARQQFAQVMAVDATNARGHLGQGHLRFHEGDWAGAVAEAQSALDHGGQNFAALFLLGRAAKLANDLNLSKSSLEKAAALMEKSIELNPGKPEGYYLHAEVCFAQDQFSTALEKFRAAQDRAEKGKYYSAFGEDFALPDVLAKQAVCHQRLGNPDRARALGEEIVKLDPKHKLGQALKGS